jgi:hypothetical protein
MCSANSLLFAADSELLAHTFNVGSTYVTMCSNIFNLTYVPLTFLAVYLYKRMQIATVIRLACLVFLLGSWTRLLFYYIGY